MVYTDIRSWSLQMRFSDKEEMMSWAVLWETSTFLTPADWNIFVNWHNTRDESLHTIFLEVAWLIRTKNHRFTNWRETTIISRGQINQEQTVKTIEGDCLYQVLHVLGNHVSGNRSNRYGTSYSEHQVPGNQYRGTPKLFNLFVPATQVQLPKVVPGSNDSNNGTGWPIDLTPGTHACALLSSH